MSRLFVILIIGLFSILALFSFCTSAAEPEFTLLSTDGSDCHSILDGDRTTSEPFYQGTELTLQSQEPITGIYIEWESVPGEWTLFYGDSEVECGKNGFLHEFIPLSGAGNTVSFRVSPNLISITDLYVFSGNEIPDFVQVWKKTWEEPVDVLFYGISEGDERSFFQGMVPENARVQAVYFLNHTDTEPWRNHEILDALWKMGFDHYPQFGGCYDYSYYTDFEGSPEDLASIYKADSAEEILPWMIDRFQPQVIVFPLYGEGASALNRYASRLIANSAESAQKTEGNPKKILPVTDNSQLTAKDVMQGIYTYYQQADKAVREEQREQLTRKVPAQDIETDQKAGNSLKILLFMIAAIILFLIAADLIIARTRRYR